MHTVQHTHIHNEQAFLKTFEIKREKVEAIIILEGGSDAVFLIIQLINIIEACGAWSKLKKWSEYKCIEQLPDSAQSEYFILSEVPNTPRLVISRVWKTGSTALAQVIVVF
jgi:hypothetical protein